MILEIQLTHHVGLASCCEGSLENSKQHFIIPDLVYLHTIISVNAIYCSALLRCLYICAPGVFLPVHSAINLPESCVDLLITINITQKSPIKSHPIHS